MRTDKRKDSGAPPNIVCGTLDNMQEAYCEVDPDMKVIWTQAGFWGMRVTEDP